LICMKKAKHSHEAFIKHYHDKYSSEQKWLPL
jgi:hypothetical protein